MHLLIIGLFGFLFEVLIKIFNKVAFSLPLIAAYISLVVALTVAYLFTANAIVSGIHVTVPSIVLDVWGWVMPSNTSSILTALFAAKLLKWAYTKHLSIVHQKTEIVRKA